MDKHNGRSVLHWAAATGRDRLLKNLLAAGANVNTQDNDGTAPLDTAVLLGSERAVRRLLESGAAVEHHNKEGWTALHLAAITGNDVVARLLLERGADISAMSTSQLERTPLHYSVMHGHIRVVKLLLEHGADMSTGGAIGTMVAQNAALEGQDRILELLFRTAEDVSAIVASAQVALLAPLVEVEITIEKMDVQSLVDLEELAEVFCF